MTNLAAAAALGAVLSISTAVLAAAAAPVNIGYIGLSDDPRYDPDIGYARMVLAPGDNPYDAAVMGVEDLKIVSDAVDQQVTLDHQLAPDAASLIAKVNEMVAKGEHFIIADLPAPLLDEVAAGTAQLPVTLINATAPEDYLRNRCYPNLLHTAASDRMKSDALVQYLRTRNWTRVLMLVGQTERDREVAASFRASAERLRLSLVDERPFTIAADPANREANNPLLLTGNADYDIVFIADSDGEYARYLPYATQLPRPVVGAIGLIPSEWHWTLERYGAPQVTTRFAELTDGRQMSGRDWSTWMAAKAVVTAYAKSRTAEDHQKVAEYMRGTRLKLDGSKGVQMNFRPWDGQMRMPLTLNTPEAVIGFAPLDGFLHQTNTLDTLGTDEPEHQCQ